MSAPYAVCNDCGFESADREAATKHGSDTMQPTGEQGITASGHSWRVVNPSPEEEAARKVTREVSWAVEDAVGDFIQAIDRKVERGDLTAEEVALELRHFPDFADAWDQYVLEMG